MLYFSQLSFSLPFSFITNCIRLMYTFNYMSYIAYRLKIS